jgi:hypothetical protein
MIPGKALLAAAPLALAGVWLGLASHERVRAAREEVRQLETEGRQEGDSYVRTLQGSHAERQLEILSHKRDAAVELAAARRNRLLGIVLVVFAGVAFVFVRAGQHIAAELDEHRRAMMNAGAGRRGN